MTMSNTAKTVQLLSGADIFSHGHLPVAATYCRQLGLIELVNRLVPNQMLLTPGIAVQAMVLDILSGRTPLYRVEDFMAQQDVELLLGESIPAAAFNDTNLGRCLDDIFTAGPSKIITELGIAASAAFKLDTTTPSYDTTSTSVWGDYRVCKAEKSSKGPIITHGHSKDSQPQLKQFMTELLCVDRGVPIFGATLDGNSSDKTSNNTMLSRISAIMAMHGLGCGAFVYVADSAVITENNLDIIGTNLFVSRLPATYNECEKAIQEAVAANTWEDIGHMAEIPTGSNRPCAIYKFFETTVNLYSKKYRAVVVHSSSHDKRRQKKLQKAIVASAKAITTELATFETVYFCEADANAAGKKGEKLHGNLHTITASVNPIEVRKRGRPSADGIANTATRYILTWKLTENCLAVQKEQQLAGCFVLVSNVPTDGIMAMDGKKLLQTYKGQYGVESDFAFLKDPLIVNDIFLKTPSRIDALGMILIIALMIWRLMERSMRVSLENTKTDLTGWCKRRTTKPTSFMMMTALIGIQVVRMEGQRFFLREPGKRPKEFLVALGLDISVFLDPHCRCQVSIPVKLTEKG